MMAYRDPMAMRGDDEHEHDEEHEVQRRSQRSVNYNPVGGTGEKACANCQWFCSPDGCAVVEDEPQPITPNGLSDLWLAREIVPEKEEVFQAILDTLGQADRKPAATKSRAAAGSFWARMKALVAEAVTGGTAPVALPAPIGHSFEMYKDTSGAYRWIAIVSNKWRDRDNPPEIIEEKAHREFVDYLDKGGKMPEAWLWHTPGTRWGQADWADYADGFLLMSGTVDAGMEPIAKALAADGDGLGVSHGFHYRGADDVISWYRTFEVSPLPRDAAANVWTGMQVLRKEIAMPFSAAKRMFLAGKLGEERVAQLEANTTGLAKALEDAGIDYKDLPPDGAGDPAPPAAEAVTVKALTDALAPQFAALADGQAAIKAVTDTIPALETAIKEQGDRIARLERSEDDKVADLLKARSDRTPNGYRASQSEKTIIDKNDPAAKERPAVSEQFAASLR